ncbi:MAG: hypothetical protein VX154_08805 [Pseudomonadota bacterium]|nr:hypothetical protein [Pseudomonadota bacterium]
MSHANPCRNGPYRHEDGKRIRFKQAEYLREQVNSLIKLHQIAFPPTNQTSALKT